MIIRIARVSTPAFVFALLLIARSAIGDSPTTPNLSPDGQTSATKKSPLQQQKSQPSVINKVTTGTKKFFTNVGDTLTLKKSQSKKTTTPTNPWFKPPKEEPKPSWLSSMFHKEEPKKSSNPGEWISQPRLQ